MNQPLDELLNTSTTSTIFYFRLRCRNTMLCFTKTPPEAQNAVLHQYAQQQCIAPGVTIDRETSTRLTPDAQFAGVGTLLKTSDCSTHYTSRRFRGDGGGYDRNTHTHTCVRKKSHGSLRSTRAGIGHCCPSPGRR